MKTLSSNTIREWKDGNAVQSLIGTFAQELYPMTEDMEVSSRYEEVDYEEYGEEAEARIEPFRRRRKPYRFLNLSQSIVDFVQQEEKEAQANLEPGLLQWGLH